MVRRPPTSRLPTAMDDALAAVARPGPTGHRADAVGGDPDGYVCPFCGQTYAGSRRRCSTCDGLPVVPRENHHVYEAVVGLCGPRCDPTALEAADPPTPPR